MKITALLHKTCSPLAVFTLLLGTLLSGQALAQGTLEKIRVLGPTLEGNLEGDDPERDVFVYLPPGYAETGNQRYPVIYFLHGYSVTAQIYAEGILNLPAAADEAIAAGAQPAIIVLPDAYTIYGGSMYSNSPTVGDWESFVAQDLVAHIDAHYRTLPTPASRGLSGHSMGGYGTMRIAMKRPGTFSALYAMSSCCLMNQTPSLDAVEAQIARMAQGPVAGERGMSNAMQAQAAAWASNPQKPPYYFDWPYLDGDAQAQVQAKWTENSPLVMVEQHAQALQSYKAIMLDVGDKDSLANVNRQLDTALTRLGVSHGFEVYDGDHGNRVGQRFVENMLPFFTEHLAAD
jgi:S-formylglutathione hydrolase FrmB